VKLVILAGFTNSVLKSVNDAFPRHVGTHSLILVPCIKNVIDFGRFNWALTDGVARGAKDILLVLSTGNMDYVREAQLLPQWSPPIRPIVVTQNPAN
jgi:hypothetical protein